MQVFNIFYIAIIISVAYGIDRSKADLTHILRLSVNIGSHPFNLFDYDIICSCSFFIEPPVVLLWFSVGVRVSVTFQLTF